MNSKTIALGLMLSLAALGGAHAQDFTPKAKGTLVLNARATVVAPVGTDPITTTAGAATGLRADVGADVMPTVSATYFLTDNVAVEAIAGTTRHTIRAKGAGVDLKLQEAWVIPPIVTLQYHVAPKSRVSPYVGAGVNYMLFYSEKDFNGFGLKVDDGFGLALQAGADIAMRDNWTVNLDVKKVFFDTKATDKAHGLKTKVNLDPWVVSAGIGRRF